MRLAVPFLSGAVALGLAGACSGVHETKHDSTTTAAAPLNSPPRLDVPGLLRLRIDEVSRRLGPPRAVPAAFQDPTILPQLQHGDPVDSTAWFQYRGLNLVVAYDYGTRRVKHLLLLGRDEDELMRDGQLQPGANRYLVLPVFQQRRPTELMGLRVLATDARP